MDKKWDFCGWATKNNIKCSDGRTIRKDAFKGNDGEIVPLVWNHNHKEADNVLGHALLQNRDEGVYAYGSFNETIQGQNAKELVMHGDICSLSVFANQLKQNGGDVLHGCIREVSLVLAGANPGAHIEQILAHGEESEEEAIIYNNDETFEFGHSEEASEANDETTNKETIEMADESMKENVKNDSEETVQDVFNTLSEKQKTVVYALIGQALQDKENKGDESMKHNAFDNEGVQNNENTLTHSDLLDIVDNARKNGSLAEAFNNACLAHGITDIGNLFPEVQSVNKTPALYNIDETWVQKVMKAVHKTPFARVKSTYVDITADEARAKGYIKGNQKVEEVITALKRTTTPTTIYKLQKLDRDDVVDITDFDVIVWIKAEMRIKLDEEIARAILVSDGRPTSSNDHIPTMNIRPILGDNAVYTVAQIMEPNVGEDEYAFAKRFIKEAVKSRKLYKGSGNPVLFTTEDLLTDMLLIEDTTGRVIYDTIEKLKTALRVSDIVTVPVFDSVTRTNDEETYDFSLMGIIVNLADYNVGADKGGNVTMFDDFDINFNKLEYLIETRCSGALVTPKSAITFEKKTAHQAG